MILMGIIGNYPAISAIELTKLQSSALIISGFGFFSVGVILCPQCKSLTSQNPSLVKKENLCQNTKPLDALSSPESFPPAASIKHGYPLQEPKTLNELFSPKSFHQVAPIIAGWHYLSFGSKEMNYFQTDLYPLFAPFKCQIEVDQEPRNSQPLKWEVSKHYLASEVHMFLRCLILTGEIQSYCHAGKNIFYIFTHASQLMPVCCKERIRYTKEVIINISEQVQSLNLPPTLDVTVKTTTKLGLKHLEREKITVLESLAHMHCINFLFPHKSKNIYEVKRHIKNVKIFDALVKKGLLYAWVKLEGKVYFKLTKSDELISNHPLSIWREIELVTGERERIPIITES